jgi:hypothetical protein
MLTFDGMMCGSPPAALPRDIFSRYTISVSDVRSLNEWHVCVSDCSLQEVVRVTGIDADIVLAPTVHGKSKTILLPFMHSNFDAATHKVGKVQLETI